MLYVIECFYSVYYAICLQYFHINIYVSGSALTSSMIHEMMKEMPPLINENDLHVSQVSYYIYRGMASISKFYS